MPFSLFTDGSFWLFLNASPLIDWEAIKHISGSSLDTNTLQSLKLFSAFLKLSWPKELVVENIKFNRMQKIAKNRILQFSTETLLLLSFIVAFYPLINDSILIQVIIKLEKTFYFYSQTKRLTFKILRKHKIIKSSGFW